ncbi:hypothetical protein K493DRAFT_297395 [Basidiobolus meristosporus CBS 931.73]|uniref:Uncharacterized protein n=1 Tax=Basidiobolus meristosporus CBS 931.73 TaxID=1314790 RepID=A0A1Y1YZY4_9FUNG|nr:hypothetical protein K493DRAFT_297395 [Basidiobolus meristosporus CBS 931.73]|eukprot:ORY03506.1 hypothetical protein K493DRAFT_297395 [Basidiobolus meristosporus CBS 931.73]
MDTGYFDAKGLGRKAFGDGQFTNSELLYDTMLLNGNDKSSEGNLVVVSIHIKNLPENESIDAPEKSSMKPEFSTENNEQIAMAMRRVYLYPLVYVIITLPGLLIRLLETLGIGLFTLELLQSIPQLTGLTNAILYGFTGIVRRALYDQYLNS